MTRGPEQVVPVTFRIEVWFVVELPFHDETLETPEDVLRGVLELV
jgi:hypothetical protein